ncbi:superoxide dismutase family protein [Sphaerisporangium perillae]|uniref:superoxide dismutase family protein n=1 Tax=Sphaerisporangium perillae TaxID=2935860 RepID=UPI00200D5F1A|nr:superoxide dismutase family protein [Sphaerisporangium perillae]
MMAVRAGVVAMVMPLTLLSAGAVSAERQSRPMSRDTDAVLALGRFGVYGPGQAAITYDPKLVPTDAAAAVAYVPAAGGGGSVQLRAQGLLPNRAYGAHVHTKSCGAKGDDAGPHYQHVQDPVTPSTNPKYANPRNEVWLDFTTDARGNGFSRSALEHGFGDRHPRSVIIHTEHTHTDQGHAGQAGARLACINVDF